MNKKENSDLRILKNMKKGIVGKIMTSTIFLPLFRAIRTDLCDN
jgi:hypothetical protein